jgi:hypothetical protein
MSVGHSTFKGRNIPPLPYPLHPPPPSTSLYPPISSSDSPPPPIAPFLLPSISYSLLSLSLVSSPTTVSSSSTPSPPPHAEYVVGQGGRLRKDCSLYRSCSEEGASSQGRKLFACHPPDLTAPRKAVMIRIPLRLFFLGQMSVGIFIFWDFFSWL